MQQLVAVDEGSSRNIRAVEKAVVVAVATLAAEEEKKEVKRKKGCKKNEINCFLTLATETAE